MVAWTRLSYILAALCLNWHETLAHVTSLDEKALWEMESSTGLEALGLLQLYQDKADTFESPKDAINRGVVPNKMQSVNLVEATGDADATCNDGTAAAYYWSPAPADGDAHAWFVFLDGGGWCWDAATCAKRSGDLVSSAKYSPTKDYGTDGIFGSRSPTFRMNRIHIRYCSSDAWMGDIGSSESQAGVNWRGARIVRATLRHLVEVRGLADGDTLLFGGASAGARGAMVHLDSLKKIGIVPVGVQILGVLDSPFWMDLPAFNGRTSIENRFVLQVEEVVKSMQNEEILRGGGACNFEDAWQCAFGQYRIPTLKTPYILYASQYDWFGLFTAEGASVTPIGCFPRPQCPYYSYADTFAKAVLEHVEALPQVLSGMSGLYSSRCYDHAMTSWKEFNLQRVNGVTMAEALQQAVDAFRGASDGGMPVVVDAQCDSLNCGSGCMKSLKATCGLGCPA